jgi:hypothetical protein
VEGEEVGRCWDGDCGGRLEGAGVRVPDILEAKSDVAAPQKTLWLLANRRYNSAFCLLFDDVFASQTIAFIYISLNWPSFSPERSLISGILASREENHQQSRKSTHPCQFQLR